MRISNGTYIELVYFNDEEVSNQKVESQGNAREFRIEHQDNNNWDGFEKDELFYLDEEVSNQKVEFQGNAREFRIEHQDNNNWDGFEKDELFYLEEEQVRVFEKVESEDEKGNVDKIKYF